MSTVSTDASPPSPAWDSLVRRSIEAWEALPQITRTCRFHIDILRQYTCLEDFLEAPRFFMFWFFQRREAFLSQSTMTKWGRDHLDDYVLLPADRVSRSECLFVSHFWRTKDSPDPDGKYLRLLQSDLQTQTWSYVWVDWSCAPQHPRTEAEQSYFLRTLGTIPGIIRNCGFAWYYPPFEPRLWILYEVAEYTLTTSLGVHQTTADIREFIDHVKEMVQVGVRPTLESHGYKCTYDGDKEFLTSWLELLVLLKRLHIDVLDVRRLLDFLTWEPTASHISLVTRKGLVELYKFEGILILEGERYTFTPFPELVSLAVPVIINDLVTSSKGRQIFWETSVHICDRPAGGTA